MHRTQLLLKEDQYEALKARARKEDKSISELLRRAVDLLLGWQKRPRKKRRLSDICGIINDPGGPSGRDHDEVLYGWKK